MAGRPRSRFYEIAQRIARRAERSVRAIYTRAAGEVRAEIDELRLISALQTGQQPMIDEAAGAGRLGQKLAAGSLEAELLRTAVTTGTAAAEVVTDAVGVTFSFDVSRPGTALAARTQTNALVVAVTESEREALRLITALGAEEGLTYADQARMIREVVGLRPSHVAAPSRLAAEIRDGHAAAATRRRLSASDKAQIRSRIARGTVTREFVDEMVEKYSRSLLNRRALDIARTETLRAAHLGQREAWRQGVDDGMLPADVRKVWIVTPDDRLRDTHAAVPGMNPLGVLLADPFDTPLGPSHGPPLEPLCRCGEGLRFPGQPGVM